LSLTMGEVQVAVALHEDCGVSAISVGQFVITGARLSFNVIVNEHELTLPAASVAVSVISCVVLCPVSTVPATGDCVSVAPQLSVTVTV